MNFEEWYQSEINRNKYSHEKYDCRLAWDACKNEVLTILKECNDYYKSANGSDDSIVGKAVFKKIENL